MKKCINNRLSKTCKWFSSAYLYIISNFNVDSIKQETIENTNLSFDNDIKEKISLNRISESIIPWSVTLNLSPESITRASERIILRSVYLNRSSESINHASESIIRVPESINQYLVYLNQSLESINQTMVSLIRSLESINQRPARTNKIQIKKKQAEKCIGRLTTRLNLFHVRINRTLVWRDRTLGYKDKPVVRMMRHFVLFVRT